MLKLRVLTSVSVVALATAAGVTGAKAQNLTITDFNVPTSISVAAGSSDKVIADQQVNSSVLTDAKNINTIIAYPNNTLAAHDVDGGVDNIFVGLNTVFALATGNKVTNSIDFYLAENGGVADDTGAATLGWVQLNVDNNVTALVDNSDIQISVLDLGAGSSATVDTNRMTADGFGNTATNSITGNVNPLQVSTEVGQVALGVVSPVLAASATALIGNVQSNVADQTVPILSSTVSDSRIGLLAQTEDKTTEIVNVPLEVTNNVIAASFTGNNAANTVDLGNGGAVTLQGTAGVANLQVNDGRFSVDAEARNVTIEAGNTQNASPDAYISDLKGSSVNLDNNTITADAASNSVKNSVGLDGLNQDSQQLVAPTRQNTVNFGSPDQVNVKGDLFIASAQYSSIGVNAKVNGGSFNELVEDVVNSTLSVDDNTVGASADGSVAANDITVTKATSFTSLVALSNVQYTEGLQTATNASTIVLDVASTAGATQSVTNSGLTVDGNSSYAEAMGNSQSSIISIDGTSVTGESALIINPILSNRILTQGGVSADISLLNAQVLDGGGAVANLATSINVDVANETFTVDSLSVSNNDIHGLAVGNLSTEASVIIDATTVAASVGVANAQTVEDGAQLSSIIGPTVGQPAFIDVDVGAGNGVNSVTVDASSVTVDGNTFNSRVWGNLADATTNSIQISGVDVGDAQAYPSRGSVTRGLAGSAVSYTALDSGFALLNDQSVEDLEGATVTATAGGDLINVTVGDTFGVSSVTNTDISASKNSATTSATLNQATNEIGVSAVTLNAGSGLANVQTLADENNNNNSASINVNQNDLDITVDVLAGDAAISKVNVAADGNSMLASGRINLATNSIDLKAQTQVLDTTIDSSVNPPGTNTANLGGGGTAGQGEALLINDQAFEELGATGLTVKINDNDITVDLSVDGNNIDTTVAETNKNTINAVAAGNDASNSVKLDVGSFDTSAANAGDPNNGPIATIVSNQYGLGGLNSGGINSAIDSATISVDVNSLNTTVDVVGSTISADSNTVRALSRANNVSNSLTASGTVAYDENFTDPTAAVSADTLTLDETTFGVASRQINSESVSSSVTGTTISVQAGNPFDGNPIDNTLQGTLDSSSLTANSNLVVSEARGSDASNSAALNFTLNGAQATVANLQLDAPQGDDTLTYSANTSGTEITALSDAQGTLNSSLSASNNAVAALASASRATNTLNAGGTNVNFRNGDNASTIDINAVNAVQSDASLLVLNAQGSSGSTVEASIGPQFDPQNPPTLSDLTLIGAVAAGPVDSGSVSANNNLILAQAVQLSAGNALNIDSKANITQDGIDSAPGASVVSVQSINDTTTQSSVVAAAILAVADNTSTEGSVAMSAVGNQIVASAVGGAVSNSLSAKAGAAISSPSIVSDQVSGNVLNGDPTTTQAGYAVLNVQYGTGATVQSGVALAGIFAGTIEDYASDSAKVNDNIVQAEARGFTAINSLTLDAGSSADASGVINNVQALGGSGVTADVIGVLILTGNGGEGALDSSLTVAGNAVQAIASGNAASNTLSVTADASLGASSGAGVVVDPDLPSQITVSGSDYSILNNQSNDGGLGGSQISASIQGVGIGIDGLQDPSGVNNSALNVEGNEVLASAVGNSATNTLVLNTGTYQYPTASISNLQSNTNTTISASVDGAAIGIGGATTINAASTNSSFTVRGNSIGASAIGNSAVNTLRAGD
jgi:hypothetical protein